jgi:hypothetical protein
MKISPAVFSEIPSQHGTGLCIYGAPTAEIIAWAEFHKIQLIPSGAFTNLVWHNPKLSELFIQPASYDYMDGFSPNLNKHLHLGHLSNLVYAKAFKSMGLSTNVVALLGDTLTGTVTKQEALTSFNDLCSLVDYKPDLIAYASEQVATISLLQGTGITKTTHEGEVQDYTGTKGFLINNEFVVGIKSTGATTYFYQDVGFAEFLASKGLSSGLYLTGQEQAPHFQKLNVLFPNINSVALGLVSLGGAKMASSKGNVLYLSSIWADLTAKFSDPKLVWNILAGFILKSAPQTAKKIDLEQLSNPKNSPGLYLSYTLAKLKSAGLEISPTTTFNNPILGWNYLLAQTNLNPSGFLNALLKTAKELSSLYVAHKISGHPENHQFFQPHAQDLVLGLKLLGFFDVNKV